MLNIMMMLIMLMLIKSKYSWYVTASTLLILSPTMLIKLSQHTSIMFFTSTTMMDSLSSSLISLSMLISALMLLASTKILIKNQAKFIFIYSVMLLLIVLIFTFSSSNMIMFYLWFEASLIPTIFMIVMWGYQPERTQAGSYLILYTVTASLPMLLIIINLYMSNGSAVFMFLLNTKFLTSSIKTMLWIMMIMAMLVKLPMFITHLWLPKAHVEAPVAGSMILAAILLKLGGYGAMRVTYMFQQMNSVVAPMIISLSLIGATYTSLICMRQPDLKALIAYSSIGHMALLLAALMTSSKLGMSGAMAMMIAHGISSSALFSIANSNYEMMNTRSMFLSKGLMTIFPMMTMWWFLFTCANMAAPLSINLFSEILLISTIISKSLMIIIPTMLVSFLTAAYCLFMYTSVNHGSVLSSYKIINNFKTKDILLFLLHTTPIILLMIKPELIIP